MCKKLVRALIWILSGALLCFHPTLAAEPPPPRPHHEELESLPRMASDVPQEPQAGIAAINVVPWSKLVFQSLRDDNWEIYIANGDGTNQTRLTWNGAVDAYPRLNRGCTRIVFASNRTGDYRIFVMNADGSGVTQLTALSENDFSPDWSPDGTQIVFSSYRDGQSEIYKMNADGSGITRLTWDAGWDGEPAWSTDGSAIAFTSYRNSVYRIWRMNADGSNQVQISNQPYSENPTWSPDGSQIAYDADGNGDGWLELWVMNADGTNQHQVYSPGAQFDAWARSWSPDGCCVAFTRISFVNYYGQWYWKSAYLDAWDSTTGSVSRLSSQGTDWYPGWQTTDALAPTSSINALPAQSPGPFSVGWSGADNGPAGLLDYDIQVKDGSSGVWTDWLRGTTDTSASYPGVGGHTYYFRLRARDYAYNVEPWSANYDARTTVEALPPTSTVKLLPPYFRSDPIRPMMVSWEGYDSGGSGISAYDVQYRDTTGEEWTDWKTGTAVTSTYFLGTPGHTYDFRSRAIDHAFNVEPWPPGNGDTQTTFYQWAIGGTAHNNNGVPVQGAVISTLPEAMNDAMSDTDGAYTAYVGTDTTTYAASIVKAGYGILPTTTFTRTRDAQVDMVLPPADNVVSNWDFESSSLEPGWQTNGLNPAVLTTTQRHTGDQSACFRQLGGAFMRPSNISNMPVDQQHWLQMIPDRAGGIHMFWRHGHLGSLESLYYARRAGDGTWLVPPASIPVTSEGWWMRSAIGPDGAVHVAGLQGSHIAYVMRPAGGSWLSAVLLTEGMANPSLLGEPEIAVGADNTVHVVWNNGYYRIYWSSENAWGEWTEPQAISGAGTSPGQPKLAVDQIGGVHVVWTDNNKILYACRQGTEPWSEPKVIYEEYVSDPPELAVEADGRVHIAWANNALLAVRYTQGSCNGTWSTPETVGSGIYPSLAVDRTGTVHLLWWLYVDRKLQYAQRPYEGSWSTPQTLAGVPIFGIISAGLGVDDNGNAHVVWMGGITGWEPGTAQLYYTRRTNDSTWSSPQNISGAAQQLDQPVLAVEGNGRVHAGWSEGIESNVEVYYASSDAAQQTGDSTLSQTINVPVSSTYPALSFLQLLSIAPDSGSAFSVTVDNGSISTTLSSEYSSTDWTHRWFDLQSWAGQSVTLTFAMHQVADEYAPWACLDEVTVGSMYPDLWINKHSSNPNSRPGDQVAFTLTYGNRGGAPASSVRITDTLPSGLLFVDASPPPQSGTMLLPWLVWDIGNLPAQSESASIVITATVAPTVTFWSTLTNTVSIATASPELETANNEAQAGVLVSPPDVWITKHSSDTTRRPGDQVVFTIAYGNQGLVPADSVRITDTLPNELFFVEASPPPLSGPTLSSRLTWDIGNLPAQSEPAHIVITATVAPTATLWRTLTNTVSIATTSPELETVNNVAQATIYVTYRVYLPLVMRGYWE
jgi:uncharacterized repeat protein (TIGR01451 family)